MEVLQVFELHLYEVKRQPVVEINVLLCPLGTNSSINIGDDCIGHRLCYKFEIDLTGNVGKRVTNNPLVASHLLNELNSGVTKLRESRL